MEKTLRDLIVDKYASIYKFAIECEKQGISKVYIYKLASGERHSVSYPYGKIISDLLDIDINDLFKLIYGE